MSLVSELLEAFEEGDSMGLTLCDLSKAFDCVSHKILLEKLQHLGLAGAVLNTLRSYLTGRRQVVDVEGARSVELELLHGVPQGSVLGPLLFLVLINDLDLEGRSLLFADDTTLLARGRDLDEIGVNSARLLDEARAWFVENKLQLNEDKTQNLLCTLKAGGSGDSVKLLGFWIDAKLTWGDHVTHVCHKLSRILYLLRKLKMSVPADFLISAYHALFHTHISYGLILWGHAAETKRILILQKKAVRMLSSAGYMDHCKPLFTNLRILTIYSQYVLESLVYVKDNLARFPQRNETHLHNTRRANNIEQPRCRLSKSLNSFPISAIKLFNTLPEELRQATSGSFRKTLHGRLVAMPLYSVKEFYDLTWT